MINMEKKYYVFNDGEVFSTEDGKVYRYEGDNVLEYPNAIGMGTTVIDFLLTNDVKMVTTINQRCPMLLSFEEELLTLQKKLNLLVNMGILTYKDWDKLNNEYQKMFKFIINKVKSEIKNTEEYPENAHDMLFL